MTTKESTHRATSEPGGGSRKLNGIERQLAVAQELTHIGSWEWDVATNRVTWSDELYRIYGFEPQSREVTLEFFVGCLHPDDRARVQQEVGAALARGGRFSWVERVVRPDGSVRTLDTVGEVACGADGRPAALLGTCRDVTDERKRDEMLRLFGDIVQNVQIGLIVWCVDPSGDASKTTLIVGNEAADAAAGFPLAARKGDPVSAIFPAAEQAGLAPLLAAVARSRKVHEVPLYREGERTFAFKAFPLPGECVGLAIEDTTARTRARALDEAEQRALEMIATGAPLGEILAAIVLMIEAHSAETLGSILILDAEGAHVEHVAAPHLPASFVRAIDGAAIGPEAGSCGTAAYLKKAVFTRDIASDPRWANWRDAALSSGLRSCWSTPLFATDGRVLGTFALYYGLPRDPSEADVALIGRATHVASIAIERRQLEDQLRALSAHVESVREDERTGIAREIHDELGQALTAVKMDLAWIARRSTGSATLAPDVLREKVQSISEMTDHIIDQVRRISAELRPGVLDDLGLLAALEWQAQEYERRTGTACAVTSNVGDTHFDRDLSTAVFRIFQEALTNVARHAEAKNVAVALVRDDGALRLTVRDDGKGIAPDAVSNPRSLGLLGIRERARRLGGAVTIAGAPGDGTTVALTIPLTRLETPS